MQSHYSPVTARAATGAPWERGFHSLWTEHDYWIDEIEGTIPPELHGTLWRNGPGVLDRGGQRFGHPFDGDGMICRIAFRNGRAHFRNRFVRTEGWQREQRAHKIVYRGVFGTDKPGGFLRNVGDFRIKNIANTNVVFWAGKLWALWEAAQPHRLDPWTMETLGIDDFGGVLRRKQPFAAHPHVEPHGPDGAARLVGFGVQAGFRASTITIYEFDGEGHVVEQHVHTVPGFALLHDVAITPNYYVFFQGPLTTNPAPYLLGTRTIGECLRTKERTPTRVWVFPRHGQGSTHELHTDSCFIFHHGNAFEHDGAIVVDSVVYPSFPLLDSRTPHAEIEFTNIPAGQLWRFRLDLRTSTVERQLIHSGACEFPVLHAAHVGRPYRYVYLAARDDHADAGPYQALVKVDLANGTREQWSAAPHGFVNEALFVPRRGPARCTALAAPPDSIDTLGGGAEDDGWLVALTYEADYHRSDVVILDARHLAHGPIARLRLPHHVPFGLHGSFTPQCFGPQM